MGNAAVKRQLHCDLHHDLQIMMDWDDTHLHRLALHGKEYGIAQLGGIEFRDDLTRVRLENLSPRLKELFRYDYDFIRINMCDRFTCMSVNIISSHLVPEHS